MKRATVAVAGSIGQSRGFAFLSSFPYGVWKCFVCEARPRLLTPQRTTTSRASAFPNATWERGENGSKVPKVRERNLRQTTLGFHFDQTSLLIDRTGRKLVEQRIMYHDPATDEGMIGHPIRNLPAARPICRSGDKVLALKKFGICPHLNGMSISTSNIDNSIGGITASSNGAGAYCMPVGRQWKSKVTVRHTTIDVVLSLYRDGRKILMASRDAAPSWKDNHQGHRHKNDDCQADQRGHQPKCAAQARSHAKRYGVSLALGTDTPLAAAQFRAAAASRRDQRPRTSCTCTARIPASAIVPAQESAFSGSFGSTLGR